MQGRISLATNRHDGYVENRIGKDANEADSYAYRAQLNFELTDDFSALVNIHGGESDTIAPQYQHQATDDGSGVFGTTDYFGYSDTDGDPFAGEYDREGTLNIESKGASINLEWDADDFLFTSITAVESVEK